MLTIKPLLERIKEERIRKQKERDKELRITRAQNPQGYGLPIDTQHKIFNNNKTDYIYWDDPNELVDRLRLLMASKQVGNNNHQNEIMSIIEELKEADIIE
jgi:hypothetical protein